MHPLSRRITSAWQRVSLSKACLRQRGSGLGELVGRCARDEAAMSSERCDTMLRAAVNDISRARTEKSLNDRAGRAQIGRSAVRFFALRQGLRTPKVSNSPGVARRRHGLGIARAADTIRNQSASLARRSGSEGRC
jgi:hypothetical protein